MKKSTVMAVMAATMMAAGVPMDISETRRKREQKKPHWKEIQSDEEREAMLQKAADKRERKRLKKMKEKR